MKILLINPPLIAKTSEGLGMAYGEPLGLAYVAASVEACDRHEVEVLDAMGLATEFATLGDCTVYGLGADDILQRMRETTFDVVGMSITRMYNEIDQIPNLCSIIKKEFPHVPIVVGGPDVTLKWSYYMDLGTVDYAVVGEGEITIVQLLDFLDGRGGFDNIKGICYRSDGEVKVVPQGPAVDIDDIPWPARHLFPMNNYFRNKPLGLKWRSASILTSRACPYSCAFCSTIEVWGRKWRGRAAKDVVDEIEHLVTEYGVGEVVVYDDNFLVDRKRAEAIADEIIARKIKIELRVAPGLMIHLLNVDLLRKLKKAGLSVVRMQLESGNPETLEYIDKHIDISHAKEVVAAAHSVGLKVFTNVILGFYFEDKEAIETSIRVAENIGFDGIDYMLAEPMPPTRMYFDWLKAGLIKDGEPVVMPVDTLHFKGHELAEIVETAKRNNMRYRARRFLRLRTWYGYLIPKYIYNPANLAAVMQVFARALARKLRHMWREHGIVRI